MSFQSDDNLPDEVEEDYYTLLNLRRDANDEQIKDSYRRLSRIYHPDKHVDPEQKKKAETLFTKTKKAYEVLIDPHKRAIYDTLGIKGLQTEGWELVQRTKTPQEIREEFERLEQEREQRRLQQRANPRGNIVIGINATDVFGYAEEDDDDDEEIEDDSIFPVIEISSMSIDQSIDAPLNNKDTLSFSGSLSNRNGVGNGIFTTTLRHVNSAKSWTEYQLNTGSGPLVGVKWFRLIRERMFITVNGLAHFSPNGITPGLELVLYRHLSEKFEGYLTFKTGIENAVTTTIVFNNPKHNLVTKFQLGIPNTFLAANYTRKVSFNDTKLKFNFKGGLFGALVEYGYETKLSQHSIVGTSMVLGNTTGVHLKLRLRRANQNYTFSILLCEEILPSPVFYGTIVPFVAYFCVKSFIIDPYNRQEKERELQKAKHENAAKLLQRRKEAESAISLLTETYQRIETAEKEKSGLVIIKAYYGKYDRIESLVNGDSVLTEVHDVHIPLQCLVQDSRLVLPPASKANLPGFYDPCFGEDKSLWVQYKFGDYDYLVVIKDDEELVIPSQDHLSSPNLVTK